VSPYEFKVGDKHHKLTIINATPFTLQCECGAVITKYKPSHLFAGRVRSCGCIVRSKAIKNGSVFGTIKVLRCLNPELKAVSRSYEVECTKCNFVKIMAHTSVHARYERKFGCYNCVNIHKETRRKAKLAPFCTRIVLEPAVEAFMRAHCEQSKTPVITFIRAAMNDMVDNMKLEEAKTIPTHAEIYGKLSKESFTIDITAEEKERLEVFGRRMKLYVSRSIAKLIRHAITRRYRQLCTK